MTVLGIDYSFDRPTSPAAIRAAGYAFVCRYVGGSQSKDMTASEARALIAAGLSWAWPGPARTAGMPSSSAC